MNIQDRRRAADLINSEFTSRIAAAKKTVTKADIELRKQALIAKHKLGATVTKLTAARKTVEALELSLSNACSDLYPDHAEKRYHGGCDCPKDFDEILTSAATEQLNADSSQCERLRSECRKLLAKIEVAENIADVQAVMKAAKLI